MRDRHVAEPALCTRNCERANQAADGVNVRIGRNAFDAEPVDRNLAQNSADEHCRARTRASGENIDINRATMINDCLMRSPTRSTNSV